MQCLTCIISSVIRPLFLHLLYALTPNTPLFPSQCKWQSLLHEQTASMLGANFSQLWGCG